MATRLELGDQTGCVRRRAADQGEAVRVADGPYVDAGQLPRQGIGQGPVGDHLAREHDRVGR